MKFPKAPLLLAVGACVLAACDGCKNSPSGSLPDIAEIDSLPQIREVCGTAGDGSSMNVLELITDRGDTLDIEIPIALIRGGVKAGEKLDVVYSEAGGRRISSVAVNVSSLLHLWTQHGQMGGTQSLELNEGGRATTYNMGGIDYDRWALKDGQLLLTSPVKVAQESAAITDTFDIVKLTADTLVLSAADMQSVFWREN